MNDTQFDALACFLTNARSRRDLTRLLGGAALGSSFALHGLTDAAARKKRKKKKMSCRAGQKRCNGRCIPNEH
jgi:hypothetical protein